MDIFLLVLGQLTVGFIIASVILLVVYATYDFVVSWLDRDTRNIAEIKREGAWQYDQSYFDKIEEFRSDFV